MRLQVKKLLHKYRYLALERDELLSTRDTLGKELAKKIQTVNQTPIPENTKGVDIVISPEVKQLYRILVKYLHPDVGGNPDIFIKIVSYYRQNNYAELLYLADENRIPISGNADLIEESIKQVTSEIELIKQSAPYIWGNLPETKREEFEEWLINKFNFKRKEHGINKT